MINLRKVGVDDRARKRGAAVQRVGTACVAPLESLEFFEHAPGGRMALYKLLAVFCDGAAAASGREELLENGTPAQAVRMPRDAIVIAEFDSSHAAETAQTTLRRAGALEVNYTVSEDAPQWMGHITDRITSTRVEPGQGDAEAGVDSGRR